MGIVKEMTCKAGDCVICKLPDHRSNFKVCFPAVGLEGTSTGYLAGHLRPMADNVRYVLQSPRPRRTARCLGQRITSAVT